MLAEAYYWPTWLIKSLGFNHQPGERRFCHAQLALWQALNIYDDLIDGDNSQADLMAANHNFREFLNIIYAADLPPTFIAAANKIIDVWENINRQEKLNTRLKIKNGRLLMPSRLPKLNPKDGWQKSGPLIIAPLALTIKIDPLINAKKTRQIIKLFKLILSAKQLADDACDWLDDLKNGTINPVNLLLLKQAKNNGLTLNLKTSPASIYLLFAQAAGPQTAQTIIDICQEAKYTAKLLGIKENSPLVKKLIFPLAKAAQKALNFKKML